MALNTLTPFPYADYVIIGGDQSPGQATVISGKHPSGWDERKGYMLSGATLWPVGDPLGTFAIRFDLWDEDDYPLWLAYYRKWFAPSAKLITPGQFNPRALTIIHPVLMQAGLAYAVVTDRSVLTKDEYGLWSQTIDFKQYRKPVPPPQPRVGVIPTAAAPQPTAQSAQQKAIQDQTATLQELAK